MQTDENNLDAYIAGLKKAGAKLPSHAHRSQPHITRISVVSGVRRRFFYTPEGRRWLNLATQEIGLEEKHGATTARLERHAEESTELVVRYLRCLEDRGMKLPEDPTLSGIVFLDQLKVEAGLAPQPPNNELVKIIESAVPRLGMEVRVLTQNPRDPRETLVYETLLEKGTEERRRELKGKPNARQQLYNTRSKLKLFCEVLGADPTTRVGDEFAAEFEASVNKVLDGIKNVNSRRKFRTEINRWSDYYRRMVKTASLPDNFNEAFRHLVDMSGLTFPVLRKLLGVGKTAIRGWYFGQSTPRPESVTALWRMETLFKLPTGALVGKLTQHNRRRRITFSQLPAFLRHDERLAYRVCPHLPDDFLEQPAERQKEMFDSIKNNVLKTNSPYNLRQAELVRLPYCLKEWPAATAAEFEQLATFKTADRPPIGMRRNGQWKSHTREMAWNDFGLFFGALRLPADAADVRVRGLSVPDEHLTIALIACPLVVDWFIRFRYETRTQYTSYTIKLLKTYMSLLRAETGWLRQMPQLADRLRPIKCGQTTLLSPELIRRARADWDGVCHEAFEYYMYLCAELKPLIRVGRNPFQAIEGIVKMDDPLDAFDVLLQGIRDELPNRQTQPVLYHTAIRNCALIAFIAATGFRRNTIAQLDFTGDESGHLMLQDDRILLDVPRGLFKDPNSPFFGPKHAQVDYSNAIPNVFWLVDIFKEYLEVSRPFLLSTVHPGCEDRPLFVTSTQGKTARMSPLLVSAVYRRMVERHLAENKWRGTGISHVWPCGSHSARHIRGTHVVKKTGSFQLAGDANQHSERMARISYARFVPEDRNRRVNDIIFENRIKQTPALL